MVWISSIESWWKIFGAPTARPAFLVQGQYVILPFSWELWLAVYIIDQEINRSYLFDRRRNRRIIDCSVGDLNLSGRQYLFFQLREFIL